MTRFLINRMSEDGLYGETNQVIAIFHNLSLIGDAYKEGFLVELKNTQATHEVQICICGRFVTYIEVAVDLKEGVMRFYDFKNDMDAALDAAREIKERLGASYYFHWFMEEAYKLQDVYEDNYAAAEVFLSENAGPALN